SSDGGETATGGPGGVPSQPVTGPTGKSAGEGSAEGDEGGGEVAALPQDWLAFKRFAPSASINDSPIVVRGPDGSEQQLGTGDSPSLSPDGSTVAFAAVDGQIVTAPTAGGSPTPVTSESGGSAVDPAWSPNGASIAYFLNTGGLYVVGATGNDRRLVADVTGLEPAWSPDGTSIV
nr:hypothetical protein [Micromonospora sp. DSM 115978]